jgi:hypothetical protein
MEDRAWVRPDSVTDGLGSVLPKPSRVPGHLSELSSPVLGTGHLGCPGTLTSGPVEP